ncbi:MAG: efflux RND transporter permease subunit [Pseudomonadota bacterium]
METLFFRTPRLVALTVLVIVAAGLSAFLAIGRQEDPTITNLFANVTTVYPGADPARVEALVSEKIETELQEIPEIDVIESTSSTGISVVSIELIETLESERIEQVWSEIRDALTDASRNFPSGVGEPEFDNDSTGAFASISALYPLNATTPDSVTQRYAEELADALRAVPGTKLVEIFGATEEEVLVTVDFGELTALGLTVDQVATAIQSADAKVQAGRVRTSGSDYLIEVEGEISALDRIRRIPLTSAANGTVTLLSEIATVEKTIKTPAEELAYSQGERSLLVAARINDGLQVDAWMASANARLAAFEESLPYSLEHRLIFDQSAYTAERLIEVGTNMAIGMALVIAVLFLTLGVRAALIVAMVLPLVSLASIATMNFAGMAIHQMSVTGLIVALGLLVDAAIVMTDEVRQSLAAGMQRIAAVRKAVRRLSAPLIASTVTTALSFMPMVLLPGPAGDFVGSIALSVIIMLVWSLLIAVTITPAISGWVLPQGNAAGGFANGIKGGMLARAFRGTLAWSMRRPLSAIAFALVLPVMGFMSFPTLTAQFFPGVERDQFYIEVELPRGTAISRTDQLARQLDETLRARDGIEHVSWVVGKSAPAFYYNIVASEKGAPHFAQALITTSSPEATADLVPELQASLGNAAPEARILVRDLVQGPPVNAPVEMRILGPDLDTLRELGDEVAAIMATVPEITIVRTGLEGGAPKVSVNVDENRARLVGLDLGQVARQLEATLEGATGGSLLEGTEELPVRVRVGDGLRGDTDFISNLPLLAPGTGGTGYSGIPLSAIADVEIVPARSSIVRRNGDRVNSIQGFVQYGVLPEEALKSVNVAMDAAGYTLPDGYRFDVGGDADARNDVLNNLLASVGLIVTLTIATIVMTFNSFRLSAVAFIVTGLSAGLSILALAVFQYPFGINAVIGVIGSIGVSINAAIIILTGLQANEDARNGDQQAMVDVVMRSSRHIVSTTITTFGGFLPLILGGGGFWPPFAMAIAGGVLLSTIVSFYFTPPMFRLIYARAPKEASGAAETPANLHPETVSEPKLLHAAE